MFVKCVLKLRPLNFTYKLNIHAYIDIRHTQLFIEFLK